MILGWPCWIGVVVDDLERQRHFYRDILGFTEVAHGSDWAHFDLGDAGCLRSCDAGTGRKSIRPATRSGMRLRTFELPAST